MLAFLHVESHPFIHPLEIVSAENHAHRFSEWMIDIWISKSACVKCIFKERRKLSNAPIITVCSRDHGVLTDEEPSADMMTVGILHWGHIQHFIVRDLVTFDDFASKHCRDKMKWEWVNPNLRCSETCDPIWCSYHSVRDQSEEAETWAEHPSCYQQGSVCRLWGVASHHCHILYGSPPSVTRGFLLFTILGRRILCSPQQDVWVLKRWAVTVECCVSSWK